MVKWPNQDLALLLLHCFASLAYSMKLEVLSLFSTFFLMCVLSLPSYRRTSEGFSLILVLALVMVGELNPKKQHAAHKAVMQFSEL